MITLDNIKKLMVNIGIDNYHIDPDKIDHKDYKKLVDLYGRYLDDRGIMNSIDKDLYNRYHKVLNKDSSSDELESLSDKLLMDGIIIKEYEEININPIIINIINISTKYSIDLSRGDF